MNKFYSIFLTTALLNAGGTAFATDPATAVNTVKVFEDAVYYDGYNGTLFETEEAPGMVRHSNAIMAWKLTPEQIAKIGDNPTLFIEIGALCDDYDRMGNINIALVPKGSERYDYREVKRIEIARFITPFMNKNRQPDTVPYYYELPNLPLILHNSALNSEYDFWLEAEVFGVPYDAQAKITGCKKRNDTFSATAVIYSDDFTNATLAEECVLVPIFNRAPEVDGPVNFNTYREGAYDKKGLADRTWTFEVPEDVEDSRIMLIMTNHGAGENGEEYVRRIHFVYVDGEQVFGYIPGGVSCEPYRKYNTMGNGIYGSQPQPDSYWEDWNNWCPGQAVPIREISLGAMTAGSHTVRISVPGAQFYNNDGDYRPSLYFQGVKKGKLAAVGALSADEFEAVFNLDGKVLTVNGVNICELQIFTLEGALVHGTAGNTVDLSDFSNTPLIAVAIDAYGRTSTKKIIL